MGWRYTVDPIARQFGYYTAYTIREPEFIGYLDADAPIWLLEEAGYEHPPSVAGIRLEAGKRDGEGDPHDFSARKVAANPIWQYHVHLFQEGERYRVATHKELRPDLWPLPGESLMDARQRLRTHYDPNVDDYLRGEACDVLAEQVETA